MKWKCIKDYKILGGGTAFIKDKIYHEIERGENMSYLTFKNEFGICHTLTNDINKYFEICF